jgi:hypothetical protein
MHIKKNKNGNYIIHVQIQSINVHVCMDVVSNERKENKLLRI